MKQSEEEWVEYQNVMEDVIKRSELNKSIFFDLRGNHDNFAVPAVGGAFDFFSKYSINGQLGRNWNVNSITLQVGFFTLCLLASISTFTATELSVCIILTGNILFYVSALNILSWLPELC